MKYCLLLFYISYTQKKKKTNYTWPPQIKIPNSTPNAYMFYELLNSNLLKVFLQLELMRRLQMVMFCRWFFKTNLREKKKLSKTRKYLSQQFYHISTLVGFTTQWTSDIYKIAMFAKSWIKKLQIKSKYDFLKFQIPQNFLTKFISYKEPHGSP